MGAVSQTKPVDDPSELPPWMEQWWELLRDHEREHVRFKVVDDTWFVAVVSFIYTAGIIKGYRWADGNYEDRWCYETMEIAAAALDKWDGRDGEPFGWHRHPDTGRRRTNGDPAMEYVNL